MMISTIKLFILLILVVTLNVQCAPTSTNETEAKKSDEANAEEISAQYDCELDELELLPDCKNDDQECKTKNEEKVLKRELICSLNSQCSYCTEVPLLNNLPDYENEENLVVEPEIQSTINPPIESNDSNSNESFVNGETIIIEDSMENIIDNRNKSTSSNLIERNIIVENDNEKHYYRGYVEPSSNVTTIIRLTNLINNTNVVNMPTTLNNTNINNIHIFNNKSSNEGGKFGLGWTEDGECCYVMIRGPCKHTTVGLKCRHKKQKVCGKQCTKKMIHPMREACNQIQIPYYPYIMCQQQQQPQYYPNPNTFYPQFPKFPQIEDDFIIDDDDEDDFPLFPEDEELNDEDSEWIVFQEKCKIVSEDGVHITNCTDKNNEFRNPYARNSIEGDHLKRHARNVDTQQQQHQSFMPYPMMQPVYFQAIPILAMPQYLIQPPQQIQAPPIKRKNQYYDEPIIEIREANPYKNSRKHAKKHPVVYDHDDEL